MASAMKGATRVCFASLTSRQRKFEHRMAERGRGAVQANIQAMGQMNRSLNLPQIQRIMNEFEKESSTMDMKEEMMSDAVDDAMEAEDEGEGEEMEGDKILKEVLDEIGMNMNDAVRSFSLPSWTGTSHLHL